MSHHYSDDTIPDEFRKLFADESRIPAIEAHRAELEGSLIKLREEVQGAGHKLGATGEHPRGQLSEHDEGGIQFAIGSTGDLVFVDFNTPVKSFAMTADQTLELAKTLRKHAKRTGSRQ